MIQGVTYESLKKTITEYLALSVPYTLGPKVQIRILTGKIGHDVENCISSFLIQLDTEVIELNVQVDHVHLFVFIPPKILISKFVGVIKGRTVIKMLSKNNRCNSNPIGLITFGLGMIVSEQPDLIPNRFKNDQSIKKIKKLKAAKTEITIQFLRGRTPCPLWDRFFTRL